MKFFHFCSKRSFKALPHGSKVQSFPPAEGGILLVWIYTAHFTQAITFIIVIFRSQPLGGVPIHVALILFVFLQHFWQATERS